MILCVIPLGALVFASSIIFMGLYLIVGRDEIVLDSKALRAVIRVGPFHGLRSVRRERLRALTKNQTLSPASVKAGPFRDRSVVRGIPGSPITATGSVSLTVQIPVVACVSTSSGAKPRRMVFSVRTRVRRNSRR